MGKLFFFGGNNHQMQYAVVKNSAEMDQQKNIKKIEQGRYSTDDPHEKRGCLPGKVWGSADKSGTQQCPEEQSAAPIQEIFSWKRKDPENKLKYQGEK